MSPDQRGNYRVWRRCCEELCLQAERSLEGAACLFTQPAIDCPVTMGDVMSTTEQYDVVVIGSGEAGKYLAWTLSKEGHRTTLVERKMVGGSCPNVACLPSKNIIHSAKAAS